MISFKNAITGVLSRIRDFLIISYIYIGNSWEMSVKIGISGILDMYELLAKNQKIKTFGLTNMKPFGLSRFTWKASINFYWDKNEKERLG